MQRIVTVDEIVIEVDKFIAFGYDAKGIAVKGEEIYLKEKDSEKYRLLLEESDVISGYQP